MRKSSTKKIKKNQIRNKTHSQKPQTTYPIFQYHFLRISVASQIWFMLFLGTTKINSLDKTNWLKKISER